LKAKRWPTHEKKAAATKAKENNIDPAHDFFDESSRDRRKTRQDAEGPAWKVPF